MNDSTPRPRLVLRAVLVAVSAAALAACQSSDEPGPAAHASPPATSAAPAPSPTAREPVRLGVTVPTTNGTQGRARVTVLAYRQPLRPRPGRGAPQRAGHVYAGLDVRVCVDRTASVERLVWTQWKLVYSGGPATSPVASAGQDWFSVQVYPAARYVRAGQCVRDWIPFEVPKDKRPQRVEFTPQNDSGQPVDGGPGWAL
ncbi:hypothetical protein [Actinomadura monticuli]|uniref:DUF4352 domain-containing protein n=1 Tax=Actinomadura monticuli TaxID=3097367 RepID=A0ABV4QD16_9ACTN